MTYSELFVKAVKYYIRMFKVLRAKKKHKLKMKSKPKYVGGGMIRVPDLGTAGMVGGICAIVSGVANSATEAAQIAAQARHEKEVRDFKRQQEILKFERESGIRVRDEL